MPQSSILLGLGLVAAVARHMYPCRKWGVRLAAREKSSRSTSCWELNFRDYVSGPRRLNTQPLHCSTRFVLLSAFHDAVISQTTSAVRLRGSGAPSKASCATGSCCLLKRFRAMRVKAWRCQRQNRKKVLKKAEAHPTKRSAVAHVDPHQRSLPTTQAHDPTTEDTAGFCLLCCQPAPVPLSLSTRTSQLTPCCPCGVPTWLGRAINAARRTW